MNAISLCMIVKDEEANLDQCLRRIAIFMDEIIIVDTGSSDRTKEIAYRYTDKVYDFQWIDDFAAARNYSISKAKNEYILVVDSDEFADNINIAEIKILLADNPNKIGRLLRINEFTRKGISYKYNERVNRLFSKKYYHYEGIIHEQVKPDIQVVDQTENDTYLIPLTIRHSGYEGDLDTRRKKIDRNTNLLKIALEQHPEDPYILYQLGKSYYMEEDYKNASEYFGRALYYDLDPCLEYVQDMVESYGYSLLNSGQYEAALQMLNIYEEFSHSADFIFMIALIYMNNGMFQQAIDEFLKATKKSECKMVGVNDYLALYNIGVIYECQGEKERAKRYYMKCGNYDLALERMKEISR